MSKKNPPTKTDTTLDALENFLNPKEPSPKLTNEQMDALEAYLDSQSGAMHLEIMDGFLCALATGRDPVPQAEYLPIIFGHKMPAFASPAQSEEILGDITQHFEHIVDVVSSGTDYYPFLYADPDGKCSANAWAYGFILGVDLRRDTWMPLVEESKTEGLMTPILKLFAENAPGQTENTIPAEERDEIVKTLIENLPRIYKHFHEAADTDGTPQQSLH